MTIYTLFYQLLTNQRLNLVHDAGRDVDVVFAVDRAILADSPPNLPEDSSSSLCLSKQQRGLPRDVGDLDAMLRTLVREGAHDHLRTTGPRSPCSHEVVGDQL